MNSEILHWLNDQPGLNPVQKVRSLSKRVQQAFRDRESLEQWICLYHAVVRGSLQDTSQWFIDYDNTLKHHGIQFPSEFDAAPLFQELGWEYSDSVPERVESLPYLSGLLS